MLTRKIEKKLESHFNNQKAKALLITGARQVGKTFVVRQFSDILPPLSITFRNN